MDKLDKATIVGQYALAGQENYEEYLKAIGELSFKSSSLIHVVSFIFKLREESYVRCFDFATVCCIPF